jgi:hypothetical protein
MCHVAPVWYLNRFPLPTTAPPASKRPLFEPERKDYRESSARFIDAARFVIACVIATLTFTATASGHPQADVVSLPWPQATPFLLTPVVPASSASAQVSGQADSGTVRFGPRRSVPQLPCRPGDSPETGLQGRVAPSDIATGRAALGYRCNLELVGRYPSSSAGTLESFGDCAYYGLASDVTGTQVLKVSNPAQPLPTTVLTTPAMLSPWESLKVNAKRKLLVADRWAFADTPLNSYLDIYDVSGDCSRPRLLSSTNLAPARGHEGWFSPDGMTYYMSTTGPDHAPTVFPVDISDPARPKRLASWAFPSQTHGGSTTEDGTRSYICQQNSPPKDALLIVDTSELAARRSDPQPHLLAQIPLDDNQWCQAAYRVTYDGHPFLIQYGERSGAADCSRSKDNWANFGYPRIFDLADERHPQLVSTALLQVDLPEHCSEVTGEGALNGLGYSVHHCVPDRLYDPTILACDYFGAGMRVTDIRNPYHPVEIGYYNPGTTAVVGTGARPIVHAERREIWFTNDVQGFYVVRFEDGMWPFKDAARCPEFDDYFYAQYNPGSTCTTANFHGIGKPAPGGAPPASAPSKRSCTSKRIFRAYIKSRYRKRLLSAVVLVAGRRVARLKRGQFSVRINLTGRRAGPIKVQIVMRLRNGRTVTDTRRFNLCVPIHRRT